MNSPAIRFAGFTDDWEERKLGDLGLVAMNRRIYREQTTETGDVPFYKIGTFGGEPDAYISRGLFEEYKSKYPYPEVGDILISASGSIGRTVVYTGKDEYFQDSNIVWLKHDGRLDNSFLKHFYSLVKWHGLEGSTIKRLYNKNILDTEIMVPSPNEQKAVGSFFDRLNDLITLHQREHDKTVNIKKALLEKMFPKDGEDKPEIRFAGFTGAWEQREFAELVSRVSTMSDRKYDMPRVEYEDIISGQGQLNKNIYEKQSNKRGIHFEPGDILFGKLRPYLQNWLAPDFTGIAVGDWWVLKPQGVNTEFICALLQSPQYQRVSNLSTGTKMPRSDWSVVARTTFAVPSQICEQAQIGKTFTNIDRLIALHQRELTKLQNIKKALLEKMFV